MDDGDEILHRHSLNSHTTAAVNSILYSGSVSTTDMDWKEKTYVFQTKFLLSLTYNSFSLDIMLRTMAKRNQLYISHQALRSMVVMKCLLQVFN